jgi:hypothetical protein
MPRYVIVEEASRGSFGFAQDRLFDAPSLLRRAGLLRACDFFDFAGKAMLKSKHLHAQKSINFKKVTSSQDDRMIFASGSIDDLKHAVSTDTHLTHNIPLPTPGKIAPGTSHLCNLPDAHVFIFFTTRVAEMFNF